MYNNFLEEHFLFSTAVIFCLLGRSTDHFDKEMSLLKIQIIGWTMDNA